MTSGKVPVDPLGDVPLFDTATDQELPECTHSKAHTEEGVGLTASA